MLATSMLPWAAIQSIPATMPDSYPLPFPFRTFTAQMRAPGATPTTPNPLSRAPIVPATCVPW